MATEKEKAELDRIRDMLREKQKEFLAKPDEPGQGPEIPEPPQLGAAPGDALLGRSGKPHGAGAEDDG